MTADPGALRRAFSSYRGAAPGIRAFVAARYVVAPLGPIAAEFGGMAGRFLSLGSGLCMLERYLCELNPRLSFEGIDLDPQKVELIARTRHLSPRVALRLGDATKLEQASDAYDGVLICDALHHFPADRHREVIESVTSAVRPGGTILVKDLDTAPAWKYHWNRLHDRIVAGPDPIWCRPPADMADLMTGAGLDVERVDRIDHTLTPYAHYLIRATRPG